MHVHTDVHVCGGERVSMCKCVGVDWTQRSLHVSLHMLARAVACAQAGLRKHVQVSVSARRRVLTRTCKQLSSTMDYLRNAASEISRAMCGSSSELSVKTCDEDCFISSHSAAIGSWLRAWSRTVHPIRRTASAHRRDLANYSHALCPSLQSRRRHAFTHVPGVRSPTTGDLHNATSEIS